MNYNFSISLRQGLDPDAKFIKNFGFADTFEDAMQKAFDVINDPANATDIRCNKSPYVRIIEFKKNECVGLDYGSYSRFIIVKKQEINQAVSVWKVDSDAAESNPTLVEMNNG